MKRATRTNLLRKVCSNFSREKWRSFKFSRWRWYTYKAAKSRRFEMTTIFVFVFVRLWLCCVVSWCGVFSCVLWPFTLVQRNYPFILWLVKCNFFFLRDKIDVILPRTIYCCQHNLATWALLQLVRRSCHVQLAAIGPILLRRFYCNWPDPATYTLLLPTRSLNTYTRYS